MRNVFAICMLLAAAASSGKIEIGSAVYPSSKPLCGG
jgi:hypothetical protein